MLSSPSVLAADRKPFVRGLGWYTTNDSLRSVFGEIKDKVGGRPKGFGFVAYEAHCSPSRSLVRRSMAASSFPSSLPLIVKDNTAGTAAGPAAVVPPADSSQRRVFVGNVPHEMRSDRLLAVFLSFGEIEEGPIGFDK